MPDNNSDKPYWQPTRHRKQRRAPWHCYDSPGTYMVTLVVAGRRRILGTLVTEPQPGVMLSRLGDRINDHEFGVIHKVYPNVEVWCTVIMPDHIHMILHVSAPFDKGKTLGTVINGFKSGCNNAFWKIFGYNGQGLFEARYNDGILMNDNQLEKWKHYIKDNPRRLAIKLGRPDYFTVVHDHRVSGRLCNIIGNSFLLDIPDKMAVIVHRADTDDVYAEHCREWLACGQRGGVLVSAAVAPREKAVMREAMNRGYRLIYLHENGFGQYYKPPGAFFDACASGQLLEISPWDYHYDRRVITRAQCLELNALAMAIAGCAGSR